MKHWITTKITLDVNKYETSRILYKTRTVDSNGYTLDETEYDAESNVVCKRIYRYFDTGEVKEYIEYDPSDELLERHIYSKDESGEICTQEMEFHGGEKTIKEFSFTDIGNADKATIRDENGEIIGYELYLLDESGRLQAEIELDSENNEISKYERFFDDFDRLKHGKHYIDGNLSKMESFEYDSKGNVIKKEETNYIDNFTITENYEYDQSNRMICNTSYQDGRLVFENNCEYDEFGDLISEEFFELDYWGKQVVRHEKLIHEVQM